MRDECVNVLRYGVVVLFVVLFYIFLVILSFIFVSFIFIFSSSSSFVSI